jgi:hypothetical protein
MKTPAAIKLLHSPEGSGGDDPTTSRPAPGGRPEQDIPYGTRAEYQKAMLQGGAKRRMRGRAG